MIRRGMAVVLTLCALMSCAAAMSAAEADAKTADAAWRDVLARAEAERKPIVVFFGSQPCPRCERFERMTVPHPAIVRRLPAVAFAVLPATAGAAAAKWGSADAGLAFFDRSGILRARWPIIPDTTNFGIVLDSVTAVAPDFERAVQLFASGSSSAAEIELANGLARLERVTDARAALARARAHGDPEVQQRAAVVLALLDAKEGKRAPALESLRNVVATAATAQIGAEAWLAAGAIHRKSGASGEAVRAFEAAKGLAASGSPQRVAAQRALLSLRGAAAPVRAGLIRILPLEHQVVSGRESVRTHVGSAAVARVLFSVDGREIGRVDRPPFSTIFDFGARQERRTIAAVAFDREGRQLGRDERVVNEAGESFWLRLMTPREGAAAGQVQVTMNVRAPATRAVRHVAVSWNGAERALLTAAPWECRIEIPAGQLGVLRAVAELEDGRVTEDAVLLNAGGMVDHSNVQLVEIPITVVRKDGTAPAITAGQLKVREGRKVRRVEALAPAAETPLTVGLLIDASDSMQSTLPDLQEAAIRFLETVLGARDRAFLVTFDSRARLIQPATADLARLRQEIMDIRPDGLTALHDAMVLGLLQFEGIKGRRALIVFSDGLDRTSRYRASDVSELARRVNVPIHVIASRIGLPAALGLGAPPIYEPISGESGDPLEELRSVAASAGGTSRVLTELSELPQIYARIEALLRAQMLAFIRADPATAENEWRTLQIEVDGKDVEVYAPAGYYAAW